MHQASWNFPATSRLLFEGGANVLFYSSNKPKQPGVTDHIQVLELSTGYRYRSYNGGYGRDIFNQNSQRLTMSYVPGSHAVKVGFTLFNGSVADRTEINQDVIYQFRNGVPAAVEYWATPFVLRGRTRDVGVFAQDQWTFKKWTVNVGARYDNFVGWVPPQHIDNLRWVPGGDLPRVDDVPNWKDVTTRLGASYDVFGNGRTAIKASFGKYLDLEHVGTIVSPNNPISTRVTNATRVWNDANRD